MFFTYRSLQGRPPHFGHISTHQQKGLGPLIKIRVGKKCTFLISGREMQKTVSRPKFRNFGQFWANTTWLMEKLSQWTHLDRTWVPWPKQGQNCQKTGENWAVSRCGRGYGQAFGRKTAFCPREDISGDFLSLPT